MMIETGPEKEGDDGTSRLFGIGGLINAFVLTSAIAATKLAYKRVGR